MRATGRIENSNPPRLHPALRKLFNRGVVALRSRCSRSARLSRIVAKGKATGSEVRRELTVCYFRLLNLGTPGFRQKLVLGGVVVALFQGYLLSNVYSRVSQNNAEIWTSDEFDELAQSTTPLQQISSRLSNDSLSLYRKDLKFILIPSITLLFGVGVAGVVVTLFFRRLNNIHHNLVSITHDLKGPLTSTVGNIESVLMRAGHRMDADTIHQLKKALRSAESAGALVRDIHYVSKLEASENVSLKEKYNLTDLLLDTVGSLSQRFADKGVALKEAIPERPCFTVGDISLIERLLRNVLENALRYTESGGSVKVSLEVKGAHVITSISDTGCGIAAEEVPKIFEDSYRGTNTRKVTEGSGVGLTVAKKIAELHHTQIEVQSAIGVGTTVSWRLLRAE